MRRYKFALASLADSAFINFSNQTEMYVKPYAMSRNIYAAGATTRMFGARALEGELRHPP
jgi:hypothetical protein